MVWVNQDKCAIAGVGATDYYIRGKSYPRTINEMVGEAIIKACDDAGINVKQIDGFAYYSGAQMGYGDKVDTASLMEMLGIEEVGFTAALMGMPDPDFGSSGHKPIGDRLWQRSGLAPSDIDVALIYDHFSAMVVMQLEDYGFCKKGEGGEFVESGAIRYKGGSTPVNTHGGQLSEAYIIGATHTREAVEQLRGVAINQVKDAEFALVTGGPASLPVSGCILRRDS